MLCIDLCSGEGGFSEAFREDYEVVTIDVEKKFKPSIVADVNYLPLKKNLNPEVLLMSPPCTRFSLACKHWPKKGIKEALMLVGACLEAVDYLKPRLWLLENPKARLRWFIGKPKQSIRYSDFDTQYVAVKPTDLWGNIPLPLAKGIRKGHVGHYLKSWPNRDAKIPLGVSEAVLEGTNYTRIKCER